MSIGRYTGLQPVNGGLGFPTIRTASRIRRAILKGSIPYSSTVLAKGQRLDTLAGQKYGSSNLWWILAAASGIGWGLQVPPGTIILVPDTAGSVLKFL